MSKIRPYENLDDQELNHLVNSAVDIRLRLAMLSPGEVRETLTAYGYPSDPGRVVTDPVMRGWAARFHLDTQDALLGDREARERVEKISQSWAQMRARGAAETPQEAAERGREIEVGA